MTTATKAKPTAKKGELVELTTDNKANTLAVFTSDTGLDQYVQQVKDEVSAFEHDLSTGVGRKRTASLAAKVAKIKVSYDGLGKDLVAQKKAEISVVDGARKKMRDELDDLKVLARKPLTDWECEQAELAAQEAERVQAEKEAAQLEADHEVALLLNEKHDRDLADKLAAQAAEAKAEAERQEQARLAREEQIKQDAKAEAERVAQQKQAQAEQEKQNAIAREQQAKAAQAQAERDVIAAQEREKQAKLNNEWLVYISEAYDINDKLNAEAEQKRQADFAEVKRLADIETAKQQEINRQQAEQKRLTDEQAARKADEMHQGSIHRQILQALVTNNIDPEVAKKMIILAAKGLLPNLTINY